MAKWSVQHTLNIGLILIGFLAILSSGASLFASRVLVQATMELAVHGVRDLVDGKALRLVGLREVSDASTYLLTGEEQYARAARSGSAALRERVARLAAQMADGEGRLLVDRVQTAEREYQEAFEHALGAPAGRREILATAAVGSRGVALEQALDAFVTHMEPAAVGGPAATSNSVKRAQAIFNMIASASMGLALMLCGMLIFVINRGYRKHASERIVAEEGQTRTNTALDEAKATIQLKDQFLATVSHELRNPLAPILTWTQLLRSGNLGKEKSDRGLEVIERNVVSLSELIDDLVDVSRVVSGKFRLDVRPIDLVPVIKSAAESQRPASDARQIRLSLVLDERAGMISGDSERLQQVMGNLLSNAIKFTPKGGRVQVVLGRRESHVEVGVSDTGIGIEAAFLPHIFEPFQQENGGSKRRHGGLGLGLSIVRHIVELHGGEIFVASRGPGQGCTFTVKLPLLGTGEPTGAPWPRHPKAEDGLANVLLGRLDRIKVLLVDDEPNANEAVQALLDSCGAEVRVAGSAAQALQMLDVWRPDVLISDIAMPEEDGYALIKKIRARSARQNGDIPAAALTAYAKIEDRVSILAAGFQMYLSKPTDPSELIAVVASLAARRRRSGAESPEDTSS
ncbi:MAG TPA: ATP-binding protein [Candidatus Eisenbacteria bacterium]|jgi:signal transduction histidine kinase/ActR/RegA family two-component response regulator